MEDENVNLSIYCTILIIKSGNCFSVDQQMELNKVWMMRTNIELLIKIQLLILLLTWARTNQKKPHRVLIKISVLIVQTFWLG